MAMPLNVKYTASIGYLVSKYTPIEKPISAVTIIASHDRRGNAIP